MKWDEFNLYNNFGGGNFFKMPFLPLEQRVRALCLTELDTTLKKHKGKPREVVIAKMQSLVHEMVQ